MNVNYQFSLGKSATSVPLSLPFRLSDHPEFTFNSPVGICADKYKRIWIADTGNNRVVVADAQLQKVLTVFGGPGTGPGQFNMPFRFAHHPHENWLYVSDLANKRIQVLAYDKDLNIQVLNTFGSEGLATDKQLQGPNGLAFVKNKLCVADEFYVNSEGGGRIAIFSDAGEFLDDIQTITGATDPGLLWPQGISTDENGYLYIANTGFYNIVRCDIKGNGIPFKATGTPEIEGLELSRDVSVIRQTLYVPGGSANHVNRYTKDGEPLPPLGECFAPIQVIADPTHPHQVLVSEPILAQVNRYVDSALPSFPVVSFGNPRDNQNELYFVSCSLTETIAQKIDIANKPSLPSQFSGMNWFNPVDWLNISHNFWSQTWDKYVEFTSAIWQLPSTTTKEVWMLDGGNHQIKKTPLNSASRNLNNDTLLPMLPGMLGIDALHPSVAIPGQIDPGSAIFMVTNYLTGYVSVLQYNPFIDDYMHMAYFGGLGNLPWQLNKPQGIAIHDATGDIYIADSGNNRISHWRISKNGIIGFVKTFGETGKDNGQFLTPSDVTIDKQHRLYVTDQMNNRVQVFNTDGEYLFQFGQQGYGTDSSNFLLPTSIHLTDKGLIINDLVNRAIKVFSHDGEFLTSFSGLGALPGSGELWMPYLLHASEDQIFIPDCATNQVHVYSLI